jgi:hypothetical protein
MGLYHMLETGSWGGVWLHERQLIERQPFCLWALLGIRAGLGVIDKRVEERHPSSREYQLFLAEPSVGHLRYSASY